MRVSGIFEYILKTKFYQPIILASIAFLFAVIFSSLSPIVKFDQKISEGKFHIYNYKASQQIVIVGLDEQATKQLGKWPLSREIYAELLNKLYSAGVNKVYFDGVNAIASNENHDKALQKALRKFGPSRIAMPTLQNKKLNSKNKLELSTVKPADIFANEVTLVSSDLILTDDRKVTKIGRLSTSSKALPVNATKWLSGYEDNNESITNINFGVELNQIPTYSFTDVLNESFSPSELKDKNVIFAISNDNPVYQYTTPRYGKINRAALFALGAETDLQKIETKPIPQIYIAIGTLALVLFLSIFMFYYKTVIAVYLLGIFTIGTISLSIKAHSKFYLSFDTGLILLSLIGTFIFTQIATNPLLAGFKAAILGLFSKLNLDLGDYLHSKTEAIISFDEKGRIKTVNVAAEELLGISSSNSIGKLLLEIIPTHGQEIIQTASRREKADISLDQDNTIKNQHYLNLSIDGVQTTNEWLGLVTIIDITEQREKEESLKQAAEVDSLTNLMNRTGMERRLKEKLSNTKRTTRQFSIFLMDLNGFKQVNDTYGHQTGDKLLYTVSRDLEQLCDKDDIVIRLGGDEFVIIATSASNKNSAQKLAVSIVDKIATPYHIDGHEIKIGTSIGISMFNKDATEKEKLLNLADEAMYRAKKAKTGYKFA